MNNLQYLTLEMIKHQLRFEEDWDEDDDLLVALGEGAEDFVEQYINNDLEEICADNGGTLPPAIYTAMLIMVSYLYDNDGSGDDKDIPKAVFVLLRPFKKYTIYIQGE